MARPQRNRRICAMPEHTRFGDAMSDPVTLTLDEYEAIRLMDREGCTHEECASIMQVSRTTVTEIYASARAKLAEAIATGRGLVIEGGCVVVCDKSSPCNRDRCLGCSGKENANRGIST